MVHEEIRIATVLRTNIRKEQQFLLIEKNAFPRTLADRQRGKLFPILFLVSSLIK
jgi:hypothetical protein